MERFYEEIMRMCSLSMTLMTVALLPVRGKTVPQPLQLPIINQIKPRHLLHELLETFDQIILSGICRDA